MLIDFTVSNFRSIHAPVTLSMVATERGKTRAKGNSRKRPVPTDEEIGYTVPMPGASLLTVAGIFGPNASGKSNVVKALGYFISRLHPMREYVPPQTHFLLKDDASKEPSRFVIRFFDPGKQQFYSYRLGLQGQDVVEEELLTGPEEENLILRRPSPGEDWVLASELETIRPILSSLATPTVALQLLLKTFDIPVLSYIKYAIMNSLLADGFGGTVPRTLTCLTFQALEHAQSDIIRLVQNFDTGIHGIHVEKSEATQQFQVTTTHQTETGTISWRIQEDSHGTRALFELSSLIIGALQGGMCLILDEFGAFLHPHITQTIVKLFQSPETNPKGAQLIFNSHDLQLQAEHRMRRDQIWYTERRADGSTDLYPLSAFHPRNDEAIARNYSAGRYGALPVLPGRFQDLVPPGKK